MNCKKCDRPCKSTFCYRCAQQIGYLDKYPILYTILSNEDIGYLKQNINANGHKVSAVCMKCKSVHSDINMGVLVKRLIKDNFYQCHACSKVGKTGISINDLPCIDKEKTIRRFGRMPVNVKKDKVIAVCSVCSGDFEVNASSVLHQVRRYKLSGSDFGYKCFNCGIGKGTVR